MDDQEKQPNYRILLIVGIISMTVAIVWFFALQIGKAPTPEEPSPSPSSFYALDSEASAADEETESSSVPSRSASPTTRPSSSPSSALAASASAAASASPSASPLSEPPVLTPFENNIFTISELEDDAMDGMRILTVSEAGTPLELQRILWQFNIPEDYELSAEWNGRQLGEHDIVGTGTVLELAEEDGAVADRAVVVVPGDVTGSGQLDDGQLAILTEALDNPDLLSGPYLLAADLDGSGEIDIADLRLLGQAIG